MRDGGADRPWEDRNGCGVCHVRRGDDSSVRLKVCCLFEAGNRYVTKLRYTLGRRLCPRGLPPRRGNEFLDGGKFAKRGPRRRTFSPASVVR